MRPFARLCKVHFLRLAAFLTHRSIWYSKLFVAVAEKFYSILVEWLLLEN